MSFHFKTAKCGKGRNNRNSQWKNEDCPSRMLLKRFIEVQWSPFLISFQNDDNKTILKNADPQFVSVITTYLSHILNFANILDGEIERLTEIAASIKH